MNRTRPRSGREEATMAFPDRSERVTLLRGA